MDEAAKEWLVGRFLVMNGHTGEKCECGSLHELRRFVCPCINPSPRVWRPVEQMKAGSVANPPVVEVLRPPIHLSGRHFARNFDETSEHARFIEVRFPEPGRERMIATEFLAQGADVTHSDAEGLIVRKPEPEHAVASGLCGETFQTRDGRSDGYSGHGIFLKSRDYRFFDGRRREDLPFDTSELLFTGFISSSTRRAARRRRTSLAGRPSSGPN